MRRNYFVCIVILLLCFLCSSCKPETDTVSYGSVYTIKTEMTDEGLLVEEETPIYQTGVKNSQAYYSYYVSTSSGSTRYEGYLSTEFYAFLGREIINNEVKRYFVEFECFSPTSVSYKSTTPLLLNSGYVVIDGVGIPYSESKIEYTNEQAYANKFYSADRYDFKCYHGKIRMYLTTENIEQLKSAQEIKLQFFNNPAYSITANAALVTVYGNAVNSIKDFLGN